MVVRINGNPKRALSPEKIQLLNKERRNKRLFSGEIVLTSDQLPRQVLGRNFDVRGVMKIIAVLRITVYSYHSVA